LASHREPHRKYESSETQTYEPTPDPEFESSPDITGDDLVKASQHDSLPVHNEAGRSGLTATARRVYHTFRATVLAPVALVRHYLLPIIAFGTVVLWLLSWPCQNGHRFWEMQPSREPRQRHTVTSNRLSQNWAHRSRCGT